MHFFWKCLFLLRYLSKFYPCFYNITATGKPQQQEELPTAVDETSNNNIPPPILPPTFISQQPEPQDGEFESQPSPQDTFTPDAEYPNYEDYADDYNYITNDAANTADVNSDKERQNVLEL